MQLLSYSINRGSGAETYYELHAYITTNVEKLSTRGTRNQLKAETKLKKEGIIPKKLVDFQWVGGQLADKLNHDIELKDKVWGMLSSKQQASELVDLRVIYRSDHSGLERVFKIRT